MARKLILLFVLNLIFSGLHAQRQFVAENIEQSVGYKVRPGVTAYFQGETFNARLTKNGYVSVSSLNDDSTTIQNIPGGFGPPFWNLTTLSAYDSQGRKVKSFNIPQSTLTIASFDNKVFHCGGTNFYPVGNFQPRIGSFAKSRTYTESLVERYSFVHQDFQYTGLSLWPVANSILSFVRRTKNGVGYVCTYRYDSTGVLFTGDSSCYPALSQIFTTTIEYAERTAHNQVDVTTISGHQSHVYSIDTMGRFINGRLVFTSPNGRSIFRPKLMKSPLGGYVFTCQYDSIFADTARTDLPPLAIVRLDNNFRIRWMTVTRGTPSNVLIDGSICVVRHYFDFSTIPNAAQSVYLERYDDLGNVIEKSQIVGNTKFRKRMINGVLCRSDGSAIIYGSAISTDTIGPGAGGQFAYSAIISNFGIPYQPYIPGVGPNSAVAVKIEYPLVVYPNPAHDVAYLQGFTDKPEPFTLLNQLGQAVCTGTVSESNASINLQGIPTGLYVLTLRDKRLRLVVE